MAVEAEARFRVLTPLFCAGSSPDLPELRLPSFKGVLRFWWRALAWPRLGGDLGRIQREEFPADHRHRFRSTTVCGERMGEGAGR